MAKSKPSQGTKLRLTRMLEGKYAVTLKEMMKMLGLSKSRTKWYIAELRRDDVIYTRYKTGTTAHYALRREG